MRESDTLAKPEPWPNSDIYADKVLDARAALADRPVATVIKFGKR